MRSKPLAQRALRDLVRIKAPPEAAMPAGGLACPCGASVEANATRCPGCRQSFTEPLGVKAAPGDAAAARHGREHLQKLGPTLLQFEPSALGMQLPTVRVATAVCLNPGGKRPGVAEEPVTY